MAVLNEEVAKLLGTRTHEDVRWKRYQKKSAIYIHIYINSRTPTQNKLVKRMRTVTCLWISTISQIKYYLFSKIYICAAG